MPQPSFRRDQATPSLLGLPHEVLLQILAALPLADRLSRFALACKQLHGLCLAPALLDELNGSGGQIAEQLESLQYLLARHGEHVRSLQLELAVPEELHDTGDEREIAAVVLACLASCAARQMSPGGGMRELSIDAGTPLYSFSSIPLLTALEELCLPGREPTFPVLLGSSWRRLTALRSAHLSGFLLCEGAGPALPPRLTRLCIAGDLGSGTAVDDELDGRVLDGLSALQELQLVESMYSEESLAAGSGLRSLTRLVLNRVDEFPPAEALSELAPSLRALEVRSVVPSEAMISCVQTLTGLETLLLDLGFFDNSEVELEPAAMQLPRLRCLAITAYDIVTGDPGIGRVPGNLPEGPYLASLRFLAMPHVLASASRALLAQEPSLHTLCLQLPHIETVYEDPDWSAFWTCVEPHQPLRRLPYEGPAVASSCPLLLHDALMLLKSRRPAVYALRQTSPDNRVRDPPACWAAA